MRTKKNYQSIKSFVSWNLTCVNAAKLHLVVPNENKHRSFRREIKINEKVRRNCIKIIPVLMSFARRLQYRVEVYSATSNLTKLLYRFSTYLIECRL